VYPEDGTENSASQFTPSTKLDQLVSKNEKHNVTTASVSVAIPGKLRFHASTRLPAVVCDPAGTQATFKDGIGYTVQTRVTETSAMPSGISIIRMATTLSSRSLLNAYQSDFLFATFLGDRFQVRMKGAKARFGSRSADFGAL